MRSPGTKPAFTLVELLIVISIIAILISLLFVGYPKINTLLKERTCEGNLRSIGQILQQYSERNKGYYPDIGNGYYYGNCITRNQCFGNPVSGPPMPPWTALSQVNQMKEIGATEAMFTCPFAVLPSGTIWWGTFDTPMVRTNTWVITYNYFEVDLMSYTLIWGRTGDMTNTLRDGRRPVNTNSCPADNPILADMLYLRLSSGSAGGMGGGFYHGGGLVQSPGGDPQYGISGSVDRPDSPGYNNAACNTLFAGGYIIHNEPGDFQDQFGNLDPTRCGIMIDPGAGYAQDTWWFALEPTTN